PCSSRAPGPTAMTSPSCGFSLAVSGMMMPPAVFSSCSRRRTTTRSCSGRNCINTSSLKLVAFEFERPESADRNSARHCLLSLLQRQSQHAVLELGADLFLVDLVRQHEGAGIWPDIVLSVDRLQPLVFREVDPAFHPQRAAL